ncbi:hypothetical protein QQS21_001119 [Conoideocrella luteorostrata]|uniref:Sugar phosphate transporter domain-containing protein n=1 Tax=Conoideocrella luteorostrata TaxID=1105319 RepID=A0AAJ0G293_9HYPO|nr:hypothetical protein QQS21_001119 [Conoideocrella luteorostrata]
MERFPDHIDAPRMANGISRSPSPLRPASGYGLPNGNVNHSDRRLATFTKKEGGHNAINGRNQVLSTWPSDGSGRGHGRQKSLSDAFRTIRTRKGSVSQNAHEIADALRAPVSPKLVILCVMWYTSSALTNTSSKSILNAFDKPATLTLVQFAFVSSLCFVVAWLAALFPVLRQNVSALKHPIRQPSRDVIMTTLPLAAFQIGGHLLSSTATAKIPVSLVHTIKGLSPLFTVLAYRIFYDIRYPQATYWSLIPLTAGVMLACSGKSSYGGQMIGVIQALLATLIFVTQNIVSKKIFNEAAKVEAEGPTGQSKKLDKLNLLCYSSGMAFLITLPIWFWSEGITLLQDLLHDGSLDLSNKKDAMDHGRLTLEFIFNGVFHFAQNILAFVLLSMVSPVTYSVASLIKRVFVIVMAILWFRSPTTPVQAVGIALTFLGLYLYDRTSESNKADRKARMMSDSVAGSPLLPLQEKPDPPTSNSNGRFGPRAYTGGYVGSFAEGNGSKRSND